MKTNINESECHEKQVIVPDVTGKKVSTNGSKDHEVLTSEQKKHSKQQLEDIAPFWGEI